MTDTKSRWIATLLIAAFALTATPAQADRNCDASSTGLVPLSDLRSSTYLGYQGGLYPGGVNTIPDAHLAVGLEQAANIVPRDRTGAQSGDGIVGLLAIGVSNTRLEFSAFQRIAADDDGLSKSLVLVNGAQGSRPLEEWLGGPGSITWMTVADELEKAGISPEQVQVVWMKLPNQSRGTVDLATANSEVEQLIEVVRILGDNFPNLRLAYLSSRIYGGYALSSNPQKIDDRAGEPKAYQHGFTVKWLIEEQINGNSALNPDQSLGPVEAPWLSWGPYLWADGLTPREDGFSWECADLSDDGVHPSSSGADKAGGLLLEHLTRDPTSVNWFLESSQGAPTTSASSVVNASPSTTAVGAITLPPEAETNGPSLIDEETPQRSLAVWLIVGGLAILGLLTLATVRRKERRDI